ncbi:MAG: hypothetical protein MZV63_66665 [Marinilabiliales bacterium]|nr:hypothetical protein [Marinilabiliales bacterium]
MGLNEDNALSAKPDCADLPYVLRAYFAWKIGLPIGVRACSRDTSRSPPRCGASILRDEFAKAIGTPAAFKSLMREVADAVHSGSARTALDDEETDFYPVGLNRDALWPGTIYADPYGHVLVLVRWVPRIADQPGLLMAVDAQPDHSVTRKRFWEGDFLFAEDVPSAGLCFKTFQPIVTATVGNSPPHMLGNAALIDSPAFSPYSLDQDRLTPEDFYARVGQLMNPAGLSPGQAYEAVLDALVAQLKAGSTR